MSAADELLEALRGSIPDWVIDDRNDVALFRSMEPLSRGQQLVARLWLALDGHTHLSPTAIELVQYLDCGLRAKAFAAMCEGIRRAPERTCSLEEAPPDTVDDEAEAAIEAAELAERQRCWVAAMSQPDWTPLFSAWRHGGWYVHNVYYPSGAVGCVSRNYPDRKWRIVCAGQDDITYRNRNAAAHAERFLALSKYVEFALSQYVEQHEHRPECDELGAACRICYPATNAS